MKMFAKLKRVLACALTMAMLTVTLTACGGGGGGGGGSSSSGIAYANSKLAAWMNKLSNGYEVDYEYSNGSTNFTAHVVTDGDKIYAKVVQDGDISAQLNDGTNLYDFDETNKTYTKTTTDKVDDTSLDGLPTDEEAKAITSIVEDKTTRGGVEYDSETVTFDVDGTTVTAEYLYDESGDLKYAILKADSIVIEIHYVCIIVVVDLSDLDINTYINDGYTLSTDEKDPTVDPDENTNSSDSTESKEVTWLFTVNSDSTATLTGYDTSGVAPSGSITLPSTDGEGHTVTVIGGGSYTNIFGGGTYRKVTSVTVPETVKTIANGALSYTPAMVSVSLPEGLENIEGSAFFRSGLKEVTIPASVENVGVNAFYESEQLESVTIKGDTVFGIAAFGNCTSLKTVTFLSDSSELGASMFQGDTALTSVTLPAKLTSISQSCFEDCTSLVTITIPETVTRIEDDAFKNCSAFTHVSLPNKLDWLGSSAFEGTALTQLALSEGLKYINNKTFANCNQLKKLYIPSSVVEYYGIVADAFEGCDSLTDVYYGGTQTEWENIRWSGDRITTWNMHYEQTRASIGF